MKFHTVAFPKDASTKHSSLLAPGASIIQLTNSATNKLDAPTWGVSVLQKRKQMKHGKWKNERTKLQTKKTTMIETFQKTINDNLKSIVELKWLMC